uniref:Uncharacterized protein n=1 Tax=Anopheles dirus TaxID=7168 RepID=A0A182NDR9_9DIPT
MWQLVCSRIFIAIVFIGAAHGQKLVQISIHPNQQYKLVIANHNSAHESVKLLIRIVGEAGDGQRTLNEFKIVHLRSSTAEFTFNIPEKLSPGQYKVIIDGMQGFIFHEEAELIHQ